MLKTPLCDLLGIEKPVFQGGMAWIADASLASAVSEAGGLGIIAAMNADANWLCPHLSQKPEIIFIEKAKCFIVRHTNPKGMFQTEIYPRFFRR